jgi:hypothetical protein
VNTVLGKGVWRRGRDDSLWMMHCRPRVIIKTDQKVTINSNSECRTEG